MDLSFAKGHGTRNDFVIVHDPDNLLELTPECIRFLCDRRSGIGGDGLLRVVRANLSEHPPTDPDAQWFMDYRNADGSLAEMCGNGLRVFLRFLAETGVINTMAETRIVTRAGVRSGRFTRDGRIAVTMGPVTRHGQVTITLGEQSWPATKVDVGNPHAVVNVASVEELAALDLTRPPTWSPPEAFPNGVNVEFVFRHVPGRLTLRVHERGVGETESCGTGVVAAAAVLGGQPLVDVHVPGGELQVDLAGEEATLIGPAVIVARGRVEVP